MPATKIKPTVIKVGTTPARKTTTAKVSPKASVAKIAVRRASVARPVARKVLPTRPKSQPVTAKIMPGTIVHPDGTLVTPEHNPMQAQSRQRRKIQSHWYVDVSILVIAVCLVVWGLTT